MLLEQDPDLTGHATLMDWALAGEHAPQEHEVEAIAGQLGIDMSRETKGASGGEKRRAAIARALAQDPDLLLMDEPFAALDEITRFRLNADMLDLWRDRGFTAIFVTHSVFESVFLSNRIAVMAARPGRIFREMTIDAPYPRDDTFRTSPHYAEICRDVSATLGAAMGEEMAFGIH